MCEFMHLALMYCIHLPPLNANPITFVSDLSYLSTLCYYYTMVLTQSNCIDHILCIYIGERHMTINIHNLLHLPDVVRNLGPLWSNSCFPFEAANGELLKIFMALSQ